MIGRARWVHVPAGRPERANAASGALNAPNAAFAPFDAPANSGRLPAMTEVAPARFGAVEAGGTKFVCLLGSSPDDIDARTRIPTGADPDATLA